MKKIILLFPSIIILALTIAYLNPITNFLADNINKRPELALKSVNNYTKDKDYLFVQRSQDFIPYSYQDLINIIYTVINNGWPTFTFYCPSEYENCLKDMEKLSNDNLTYMHINNYVHPFNSFTNIKTKIKESGEITIDISYLYTDLEIAQIDKKVEEIIQKEIKADMDDYDKIKTIHDYIANNTKYDVERNEKNTSPYESNTAYGPLFQGYATCNGYTDLMAIFLTKLGFDNYRIATTPDLISYSKTGHIWNAVFYNDEWVHIDLTWDDPVSSDHKDYLFHTYFLVNNEAMEEADKGQTVLEEHHFEKKYYLEFK